MAIDGYARSRRTTAAAAATAVSICYAAAQEPGAASTAAYNVPIGTDGIPRPSVVVSLQACTAQLNQLCLETRDDRSTIVPLFGLIPPRAGSPDGFRYQSVWPNLSACSQRHSFRDEIDRQRAVKNEMLGLSAKQVDRNR